MSRPAPEALLDAGLAALHLGLGEQQRVHLLAYLALLQKWNQVYNLTAVREPAEMVTHHLLDSLAALPSVGQVLSVQPPDVGIEVLDVGSGGGLPGVAWAIARPDWGVTCVDAVAKKVGFIRQVGAELQLRNLRAVHARVESLEPRPWPLITSRAFASLSDFVQLTRKLLAPGGVWVALKGKFPEAEMATLPADVEVFHVKHLRVPGLEAERCLVWMRLRP